MLVERNLSLGNSKEHYAMGHLNALNITVLKARVSMTPQEQRRIKLVSKLEEQLAMASAAAEGRTYAVTKQVWVKDAEGNRVRIAREKRLKPWWWRDGDAVTMVVRYGAKPIELAKGKRAFSVQDIAALPKAIVMVITAVQDGELDSAISAVIGGSKVAGGKP